LFKFLKEYLLYYKKEIFLALIGMLLVSFSTAAIAWLIKSVLDKIFIAKNETMLYVLPLAIIFVYFLKALGAFLQKYYVNYIGEYIVRQIRNKFLKYILNFDMKYFKVTHSGELIIRIIDDINRIQNVVSNYLAMLIRNTLISVFLLFVVVYQNPKLALFLFIILPLIAFPIDRIAKKLKKFSKVLQSQIAVLNKQLNEIFKNIETIKVYNAKNYKYEKFKKHNLNYLKIILKTLKDSVFLNPIVDIINAIVAAIIIIIGCREIINGEMNVGAFFSFIAAFFMMVNPLRKVAITYSKLQDAIAANGRFKKIFNIKPKINSREEQLKEIKSIEFKNVFLKYGDKEILKNINYKATKLKIIGLVGDSGSAKSSFIRLIEKFYDVSNEEILINDKNIKEYNIKNLKEKITYIPQKIHIFNDTIAVNIVYGKKIDEEKIKKALKEANLLDFVNSQENGSNLSGGQKQQIAIARVLYNNPDVLILDEATSALDNKSEAVIMQTINSLNNKLVFIIALRLMIIENTDEILVFKNGKIVCKGKKDEFLKNCKKFKRLYERS